MATIRTHWDASELGDLASDIAAIPPKTATGCAELVRDDTKELRNGWKANARGTARRHGVHYPGRITSEVHAGSLVIWSETGPEPPDQGGMGRGFEWGSINQPPHLDMTKVMDKIEPRFPGKVERVVDRTFRL